MMYDVAWLDVVRCVMWYAVWHVRGKAYAVCRIFSGGAMPHICTNIVRFVMKGCACRWGVLPRGLKLLGSGKCVLLRKQREILKTLRVFCCVFGI